MSPGVCQRGWGGVGWGLTGAVGCVGGGDAVKKWRVKRTATSWLHARAWRISCGGETVRGAGARTASEGERGMHGKITAFRSFCRSPASWPSRCTVMRLGMQGYAGRVCWKTASLTQKRVNTSTRLPLEAAAHGVRPPPEMNCARANAAGRKFSNFKIEASHTLLQVARYQYCTRVPEAAPTHTCVQFTCYPSKGYPWVQPPRQADQDVTAETRCDAARCLSRPHCSWAEIP